MVVVTALLRVAFMIDVGLLYLSVFLVGLVVVIVVMVGLVVVGLINYWWWLSGVHKNVNCLQDFFSSDKLSKKVRDIKF